VARADPLILIVKGFTTYPQIYPCIPRYDIFKQYSVELGYQAIQLLMDLDTWDYIVAVIKIFSSYAETIKFWPWFPVLQKTIKVKCNDVTYHDEPSSKIHAWDEKVLLSKRDLDRSKKGNIYIHFLRITIVNYSWDEGWDLIMHKEIYPTVIDIEMAIDRFLASQFIQKHILMLKEYYFILRTNNIIPLLNTCAYVIGIFAIL